MLKDMKKAIKNGRDFDLQSFKEMLLNHKNYEADTFYPKLDQELDEDTKEEDYKERENCAARYAIFHFLINMVIEVKISSKHITQNSFQK